MTGCSIEDCGERVHARGWCKWHYYRWWAHGDPLAPRGWISVPWLAERDDEGHTFAADDDRHGTLNGYVNLKCRCCRCRVANAEQSRTRRARDGHRTWAEWVASLGGRTHGIRATYKDGCRCDECKTAEREYRANYRRVRRVA